jgi:ornithine cyclodeaminase/alanine dehydrogenase-like protein (mu-crystallin family)
VPLYLTEAEVAELLSPEDALDAVEGSFRRLAEGEVENVPRRRTRFEEGFLAVMWAVDRELGLAGLKSYAAGREGAHFVVLLFDTETTEPVAVIEADKLGQLRTGAASGVAAKYLARPGASSLGVIGCGWQARSQVAAIREALPTIETVVAYCRSEERLAEFCQEVGAEPARATATRPRRRWS